MALGEASTDTLVNSSSETVLTVLGILSSAPQPLGIPDFHRVLNEPTSSIHRALATLEEAGYAARYEGTAKFVPGPMCFHLVRALVNRFPIRAVAQPALRQLVDLSEASATLNVRVGWFSLRIANIEGRVDDFQARRLGEARLLHEDVAPLAMASQLSDEEIAEYRSFVARRFASASKAALSPQLDQLIAAGRQKGYISKPDIEKTGRSWVGFALTNADRQPVAAVGVNLDDKVLEQAPTGSLLAAITDVVEDLRRTLLARAELSRSPFAHLPNDQIILPMPHLGIPGETRRLEE